MLRTITLLVYKVIRCKIRSPYIYLVPILVLRTTISNMQETAVGVSIHQQLLWQAWSARWYGCQQEILFLRERNRQLLEPTVGHVFVWKAKYFTTNFSRLEKKLLRRGASGR